ncbi:MAG: hypothetical protein JWR16_331 [Nevskia sp.]|nr:hypothetical protein [Nevskia sp.]
MTATLRFGALLLAAMLPACLSGCLSNPPYQRPSLPLPDAWHTPLATDTAAEIQASDDWWASFHDAELQQLLQRALQDSPDLRIAVDRMLAAGASIRVARSYQYPSLSFDAGPTDPVILRLAGQSTHSHVDDAHYEVGLNASYEIDFWGRVSNSVSAARSQYLATAFDVDSARIALLSAVARAYFDLRESDEMLALATQKAALADEHVRLLQLRLQAGRIVAGTVIEAQLAAQDTQAAFADLRLQRQTALQQLQALLGDTAESLQITAAPLRERVRAPAPAAGLPSSLLQRRADIRAAEAQLVAAQAKVAVARAERFPQVQLTAQFGYLTAAVVHILHSGSALIGIGPGVSLPIFDGGRSAAEVEIRQHQYDAALAEYQKSILAAFGDVEKALLGYQAALAANQRWAAAQDLQAAQIQRLQLALDAGHADRLQLIESQQRAIELQLSALLAYRQHLDSMVLLYQALGGASSSTGAAAAGIEGGDSAATPASVESH